MPAKVETMMYVREKPWHGLFTDDLIGGDVRYETAGSLREGRQI